MQILIPRSILDQDIDQRANNIEIKNQYFLAQNISI